MMGFDAVGIVSESPQRSIEFYALLGIEIRQYENSGHYEGTTESGIRLMLDSLDSMLVNVPGFKRPVAGSGVSLCFKQTSPDQVDSVYRSLIEAGFNGVKPPWDAFWGHRYACVLDPDGNQIDLFAPMSAN